MAAQADSATKPDRRYQLITRWAVVAVTAGALSATIVACSSPSKSSAPAAQGSLSSSSHSMPASSASASGSMSGAIQGTAMIMIQNFKYTSPVTVSPGATVSVMNMDGESHTVTADSGNAFDDMATAGAISTFKAPMTPGSYAYHCTYHSNMHGVLVVK